MIRKDWSFCGQILQVIAILDKKLKIFIFIFSNFSSHFFWNFYQCNISLNIGFPTIPNLLLLFSMFKKLQQWLRKSVQWIKNCTLVLFSTILLVTLWWDWIYFGFLYYNISRNTRARREIGSKLTIKTPENRHWTLSSYLF